MTVLAIVHPTDLVATDLRDKLELRPDLWHDLHLFALDKEEIGTLAESRGRPTLIGELEEDSFDKVDLAFLFGDMARLRPILKSIPAHTTVVLMAPDAAPEEAHPVVIGIDGQELPAGRPLLSPHAAVIGLAHLLHPLARFRPQVAAATVFQPVSTLGKEALDELFEQTREVLNFEQPVFRLLPRQFAFNILDGGGAAGAFLETQLTQVLSAPEISLSIEVLRAGIFHGFGISLHLRLEEDPGIEALRAAFGEHPVIELADDDLLGTIDVAAREEVLVGAVERSGPGAYRIWALIDNLTRGGATNAFGILEALRSPVF